MKVVIDTNVLVSALRSSLGASYQILEAIGDDRLEFSISVPLFLEYEDVLKRPDIRKATGLSIKDVDVVLDLIAARGKHTKLHFLWRPQLRDAKDEMVLETAFNAGASAIVTFNRKDFLPAATKFGLEILLPSEFLPLMKGKPS